jgi:ketosteroid isomerase-like protein
MSQEKEGTVRRFVDAFNRGSFDDAVADYADPELVIHADPSWPGRLEYRGVTGAKEAAAEWFENFDELAWEVDRITESDERLVVLFRLRGRIKGSQDFLEMPFGGLFSFREGKILEARYFFSQDAALEAAGLRD